MSEHRRRGWEMAGPRYGTPNMALIGRWLQLDAADDGPFWALNLMRYREVADYGAAASPSEPRSGRDADDAYAPVGPLAAIGAVVALHADVVDQVAGSPGWHRVGIVRYPSRAAFFAMQQRDDFRRLHVHKDAGMEFTIVMSCLPAVVGDLADDGPLVLRVARRATAPGAPVGPSADAAAFSVEGVIIGDDRAWDEAVFARTDPATMVDPSADDQHVLVLSPMIDALVESVRTAL